MAWMIPLSASGPTADVVLCGDGPRRRQPPKNGVTMLAIPWATSSTLDYACRRLRQATTAEAVINRTQQRHRQKLE